MIDGVLLNSLWGISWQFDFIDLFNIECIEVMFGVSVVYGGGVIGGIINIVIKKGVGGDICFNIELGVCSGFQSYEDYDLCVVQLISGGNDLFNGCLVIVYQKNGVVYDGSGDQVLMDIIQIDLQYNRLVDLMGSFGFIFVNGYSFDFGLQYYDFGYDGDCGFDFGCNFDVLCGWVFYLIKGGVDFDCELESKCYQFNVIYYVLEVLGYDFYLQVYYCNEKMVFNFFFIICYSNSGVINYGIFYYLVLQQDIDYYGMKLVLVKIWECVSLIYGVDLDWEKFMFDQMFFNLLFVVVSGGLVVSEQVKLGCYLDIDIDSCVFFFQGSWKVIDDLILSVGVWCQLMSIDVSDFVVVNQQIFIVNGFGKIVDVVLGGSKDYDVNLVNVGVIYKLNL